MAARTWTIKALGGVAALALWTTMAGAQTSTKPPASPPAAQKLAPLAAVVNGEPITQTEVEAVLKLMPAEDPRKPLTEMQRKEMRAEALDMLVDDTLIRQFLNKFAPPVTQAEFTKEYNLLMNSLKTRNMTLPDFLRDTNQTEAHLRQDIGKKVQWEKYLHQNVSEAALKKYYDENREFYDHVTVQLSHVLFRVSPNASAGVKAQERAKLLDLRQKILANGISFEDAAKKYSQCTSAAKGGDIGTIIRKWTVDERLAKAAFAMKVGEVSDVVETEYGLHLLKVTARDPGQPSDYEKIKELVRENLGMEMWQNIVSQQRKVAKIEAK